MVHAVRLAATSANLNIVWKTGLRLLAYMAQGINAICVVGTHPHRRVQRPCNLVILLKSGTASQDLGQPKLTDCTFHVPNLSLWWRRCPRPLRRLPTDTAYHVGMGERLWGALTGLWLVHLTSRLRNATVQTRGPVRNDEVVGLATLWTASARTGPGAEGGRHNRLAVVRDWCCQGLW
jgi:hypothetical protein